MVVTLGIENGIIIGRGWYYESVGNMKQINHTVYFPYAATIVPTHLKRTGNVVNSSLHS